MMTRGQEIELANCIDMSTRVCSITPASAAAAATNCRWAGVFEVE